jgi:osomolarity two-component system sensor histidine kinase NIK1
MEGAAAMAAAAAYLKSLAAGPCPRDPVGSNAKNRIELPGDDSAEKQALERELESLAFRIQQLESRAYATDVSVLPDTPNETNDSLFGDDTSSSSSSVGQVCSKHAYPGSGLPRNGFIGDRPLKLSRLADEALEGLREHVDDQSKLLHSQREELAGVNAQLLEQKQLQEKALAVLEQQRVATLERELWKHQKANEAFQKALREIGEIITAVARGDLSKKVRMNTVEMDPEITTFKRTINTMMDQLQVFSSEVSRVAREVGTEGILGGQAQIKGVDGTWKELTDNGMWPPFLPFPRRSVLCANSVRSQRHGPEPHRPR